MMNKIRKLREKKGFTLVELIVVIAIIAILTAVLVPLINNWTQQAAYTTLNDGAQTVSNSVNESISKIVAGGAPLGSTVKAITGVKASEGENQLVIKVGDKTSTAAGTTGVVAAGGSGTPIGTTTEDKIAKEIANMLDATMPGNSAFTATIVNGAVTGVVYTTSSSTAPTYGATDGKVTLTITKVPNFDGYENAGTGGIGAVGVTGIYKTTTETT